MSEEQQHIYDIAIIGGGAGGATAAIYAMRGAMDTVLFEGMMMGGTIMNSSTVENWPTISQTTGAEFAMKLAERVDEYKPVIIYAKASKIIPANGYHTILAADGSETRTRAIILAMGGKPMFLGVKGEFDYAGKGVSYCGACDGFFFKDKVITVIGGGDTAAEEALYLAKLGSKVYMVHRRDKLRACSLLQKHVSENPKIEMIWDSVVEEVKGNGTEVKSLLLKNTQTNATCEIETDGVFVFVGFKPNTEIVPESIERTEQGYIMTDYKCETAIRGIFAVGDLKHNFARQLVIAAGDGATAALAATAYVDNLKSH